MNDMNLMDELLKIPADATAATVQGIEMLLIDENKAGALLESDPNDTTIRMFTRKALWQRIIKGQAETASSACFMAVSYTHLFGM